MYKFGQCDLPLKRFLSPGFEHLVHTPREQSNKFEAVTQKSKTKTFVKIDQLKAGQLASTKILYIMSNFIL